MLLTALLLALAGCRTVPSPGPADLAGPGWTVRQGQALWRRSSKAPEVAGEIFLATREDGQSFVQFSKGGFPLFIGHTRSEGWQMELPAHNRRYSGRAQPPARLLILHLPRALGGQPLPPGYKWNTNSNDGWRLENRRTGEFLEGYFNG